MMSPDEAMMMEKFSGLSQEQQDALIRVAKAFASKNEAARRAAAPSNVVKFPIGRIVRERFYRNRDAPELVELDAALDAISSAMRSLQNQRSSVYMTRHHVMDRMVAAGLLGRITVAPSDGEEGGAA